MTTDESEANSAAKPPRRSSRVSIPVKRYSSPIPETKTRVSKPKNQSRSRSKHSRKSTLNVSTTAGNVVQTSSSNIGSQLPNSDPTQDLSLHNTSTSSEVIYVSGLPEVQELFVKREPMPVEDPLDFYQHHEEQLIPQQDIKQEIFDFDYDQQVKQEGASMDLAHRQNQVNLNLNDVKEEVIDDYRLVFPEATQSKLINSRVYKRLLESLKDVILTMDLPSNKSQLDIINQEIMDIASGEKVSHSITEGEAQVAYHAAFLAVCKNRATPDAQDSSSVNKFCIQLRTSIVSFPFLEGLVFKIDNFEKNLLNNKKMRISNAKIDRALQILLDILIP